MASPIQSDSTADATTMPRRAGAAAAVTMPRVVLHLPDLRTPVPVAPADLPAAHHDASPRTASSPAGATVAEPVRQAQPASHTAGAGDWDSELRFWKQILARLNVDNMVRATARNPVIALLILALVAVQLVTVAALFRPQASPVAAPAAVDSAVKSAPAASGESLPETPSAAVPDTTARTIAVPQPAAPGVLAPHPPATGAVPTTAAPELHPAAGNLNQLPAWDEARRGAPQLPGAWGGLPPTEGYAPDLRTATRPPTARLRGTIDQPPASNYPPGIR